MKKALIISLLLLLGVHAGAQNDRMPRLTYGAEWGYIGVIYSGYHYNFYAPEGYRVDPRGYGFIYDSNAEAYMHVGCNITDSHNLSLYMGICAIADYHHALPVSIRLTRYYGTSHMTDRWFSFIDLGSGINIKDHPQAILTGKAGGGYRISLSRDTKLDFNMALRTVLTHPDIEYYGTMISPNRINRNNAYVSAVSIGMSLTF